MSQNSHTMPEIVLQLKVGIDTYNPPVGVGGALGLQELENIQPRNGRFNTPLGLTLDQTIGPDDIITFAFYRDVNALGSNIYALSDTGFFFFESDGQFATSPFFTNVSKNGIPYSFVPWDDAVYVTRPGLDLISLRYNTAATVLPGLRARYAVNSNDHLFLANLDEAPFRAKWSDLQDPESFAVSTASEADEFDLGIGTGDITGLSNQRGRTYIYTATQIWVATYVGLPAKYEFELIYTDKGNIYHYAQVQVGGIDYFIADDGIWSLNGLQLLRVGDPIWNFFKDTNDDLGFDDFVRGYVDKQNDEVYWTYRRGGRDPSDTSDPALQVPHQWSIVYNYKEDSWSNRDPQGTIASFSPPNKLRTYFPIDHWDISFGAIDTFDPGGDPDPIIDGDWQFNRLPFDSISGGAAGQIFRPATTRGALACRFRTFETDLSSAIQSKIIRGLKILYSATGAADITLTVRTRPSQDQPFVIHPAIALNARRVDGAPVFYLDDLHIDEFFEFQIDFTNTATGSVDEIYGLSINPEIEKGTRG